MDDYLSPKQVAAKLGVCRRTLWRWVSQGLFPKPIRVNARVMRWKPETVKQHFDRLAQAG